MSAFKKINMMEATRLTREGRLNEAMRVLCGDLMEVSGSGTNTARTGNTALSPSASLPRRTVPDTARTSNMERFDMGETSEPGAEIQQRFHGLIAGLGQIRGPVGLGDLTGPEMRVPITVPEGARFEARNYANSAGSRAYKLFIPSGFVGQSVPLLVMLHGCRQSPDDFAVGTRMNELAEQHTLLVAYPAQSTAANSSKCWNWFKASDQERDQGEPSLIAGITREIIREFNVAPARVAIAGLSAGGAAAAIMGASYPDLFAAIGVHSGLACGAALDMPSAFQAMRMGARDLRRRGAVRTIVFHGDKDMTVSSVNGDQVIAQSGSARNLGISVCQGQSRDGVRYTRTVHTDESGHETMEQWMIHGLGHAWSGGSPAGSYTDPHGPDASREMLRFFFQIRED